LDNRNVLTNDKQVDFNSGSYVNLLLIIAMIMYRKEVSNMSSLLTNNEISIANTNLSDKHLVASSGKGAVYAYSPKRSNPDAIYMSSQNKRNRK